MKNKTIFFAVLVIMIILIFTVDINDVSAVAGIDQTLNSNNEKITMYETDAQGNISSESSSSNNFNNVKIDLNNYNDESIKYYEIKNFSDDVDYKLNSIIENNNSEYFDITCEFGNNILKKGETAQAIVTIKLKKNVTETQNVDYKVSINLEPIIK